jgi:hypothetical protein
MIPISAIVVIIPIKNNAMKTPNIEANIILKNSFITIIIYVCGKVSVK